MNAKVSLETPRMEVIQADGGSGSLSSTPELDKVAPFLIKLFEIVSSQASDDLVCWSEHGETFKIVHRTKFAGVRRCAQLPALSSWLESRASHRIACPGAQEVLPLYFKHDNLRSFIRQLNIYGFQRCPNASGRDRTMEFFHPMFTRNGARNLKEIKRGATLGPKSLARPWLSASATRGLHSPVASPTPGPVWPAACHLRRPY